MSEKCKYITGCIRTGDEIFVPTSIATQLVRQMGPYCFSAQGIRKIVLDCYRDSAPPGAPWGAIGAEVIYLKEPVAICSEDTLCSINLAVDD